MYLVTGADRKGRSAAEYRAPARAKIRESETRLAWFLRAVASRPDPNTIARTFTAQRMNVALVHVLWATCRKPTWSGLPAMEARWSAGTRGRITGDFGDEVEWRPWGACVSLAVRWDDDA